MSEKPIKDFEQFATDAIYAAVGLSVLGFQKAQVRRREIAEALAEKRAGVGEQVKSAGQTLRPPLEGVLPQFETLRPQIDALRPQAEAIGTQLRAAAVALRPQIESLGAGVADLLKSVEDHAGPVRHEVDVRVSEIEAHLPPPARAGFAQLRARAAAQEEMLRWVVGLLTPESRSSGSAGEDAGAAGSGDSAADEPPATGGEPPAME